MGFELQPRHSGFGLGVLYETDGIAGATAQGSFNAGMETSTLWLRRSAEWRFAPWSVRAEATVGAARPDVASSAMLQPGSGLYSAGRLALSHDLGDGRRTSLSLSQPWRAETGTTRLTLPVGRTRAGERLYRTLRVDQAPAAREIELGVEHEREVADGVFAFSAAYAHDAGHVDGASDGRVGVSWRFAW